MEQPIPDITENEVLGIIKREFPDCDIDTVRTMLNRYNFNSIKGRNRVWIAILKLSKGDFNLLQFYVEKANADFRDLLAKAEYPNYSKPFLDDNLTVEEKKKLVEEDWEQYQAWLNM
jgi:hypothetical protein